MKLKIIFSIFLSLMLSVNIVTAQKKNKKIAITGHVVDNDNNAVVGAFILVDNKNTPSYTDKNGFYKVKVEPNADLIAVFVKPNLYIEKSIEGQTTINFSFPVTNDSENKIMNADDSEVSKNKEYEKILLEKMAIELSNTDRYNIKGEEYSKYNNIYEMIQGQVPGVDVDVDSKKILIRGMNRMFRDNSPIFVVDGMPISTIDHIIPEEVERITFLKGAESVKYGSRGVNGVIVIKLKKVP